MNWNMNFNKWLWTWTCNEWLWLGTRTCNLWFKWLIALCRVLHGAWCVKCHCLFKLKAPVVRALSLFMNYWRLLCVRDPESRYNITNTHADLVLWNTSPIPWHPKHLVLVLWIHLQFFNQVACYIQKPNFTVRQNCPHYSNLYHWESHILTVRC